MRALSRNQTCDTTRTCNSKGTTPCCNSIPTYATSPASVSLPRSPYPHRVSLDTPSPALFQALPHRSHCTHRQALHATQGHLLHTLRSHTTTITTTTNNNNTATNATTAPAATPITTASATGYWHEVSRPHQSFDGRAVVMHPSFLHAAAQLSSASRTCSALHEPKDEASAGLACMQKLRTQRRARDRP